MSKNKVQGSYTRRRRLFLALNLLKNSGNLTFLTTFFSKWRSVRFPCLYGVSRLLHGVSIRFLAEKRTLPWLHCSQPPQQLWTDYSKYALVALPDSGRGVSRWPAALVQGEVFERREKWPFINPALCLQVMSCFCDIVPKPAFTRRWLESRKIHGINQQLV